MPPVNILGLLLAGGLSRRMGGGDKALRPLGGRTLIDHVIDRIAPQVAGLVLNANGDPDRFAAFGLPVVGDSIPDFAGPLAGILAGLDWAAKHKPEMAWLVSVPGDCPFLPRDLVRCLHHARLEQAMPLACAKSGNWRHPVAALWRVDLR